MKILKQKKLKTLFRKTATGKVQRWEIEVTQTDKECYFVTTHGEDKGNLIVSKPTVCIGKNKGRSNETSDYDQCLKEAQSKWDGKKKKGYGITKSSTKKYFQPMLAYEYEDYKDDLDFEEGVYVQPKLDGIRANNNNYTIHSREGNLFTSIPHLYQDMLHLDGELYNHEYKDNFEEIVSLVTTENVDEEFLAKSKEKVQMHVYDCPAVGHLPFIKRYNFLLEWYTSLSEEELKSFVLVRTHKVKSHEEITEWHNVFKALGYEGTIVRMNKPYQNKRSKHLLKYKDFVDEEFTILDYIEGKGNRKDTIGKFILSLGEGKTFKCNVKGNYEYLKKVWDNRDSYIGKSATVKFHKKSKAGVPKWGYIIKLDRESYE